MTIIPIPDGRAGWPNTAFAAPTVAVAGPTAAVAALNAALGVPNTAVAVLNTAVDWTTGAFVGATLCAAILAVLAVAGCAAKKPIVSTGPAFRLETIHGDGVLLGPAISRSQANDGEIRLTVPSRNLEAAASPNCSAERSPFRVEVSNGGKGPIEIALPAPDRWLGDLEGSSEPESSAEVESLDAILADVERLQGQGCFGDARVRDFLLQSVPMRPGESFFNAYGYRVGHRGMDLKPGIRLKIERAYFRAGDGGEERYDDKAFLGLSTQYVDVESDSGAQIRFRQSGDIHYSPASLAQQAKTETGDPVLSTLAPKRQYRLFFYTYQIPEKRKRSAVLMGADKVSELDDLDGQLRARPEKSCKDVSGSATTCVEFDGFVTLSAQVRVEVNGKVEFLEWGAKVKDVLPKNAGSRLLGVLQVQRQFMDEYYDVQFDPQDSSVLSLALVGGDRMRWSKKSNSAASH
jgi:hypothetical protein